MTIVIPDSTVYWLIPITFTVIAYAYNRHKVNTSRTGDLLGLQAVFYLALFLIESLVV